MDLDDRKIDLELVGAVTPGAGRRGNKSSVRSRKARRDSGDTKRGKAASRSERRSDASASKSDKKSDGKLERKPQISECIQEKINEAKVSKNKGAPKREVEAHERYCFRHSCRRQFAASGPTTVLPLFVQTDRNDNRIQSLLTQATNQGVSVTRVTKSDLDTQIAERHQGVVAVIELAPSEANLSERDLVSYVSGVERPLVLVLDGVTDPHNLGACLRSADAAGVHAVVVPKDNSAEVNATVRKVASGAAEAIPLVRVTNLAQP